jgi:hypothetical protein
MKYFVEYPCLYICGLQCGYCFHKADQFDKNDPGHNLFTVQDWVRFRETHLKGAEEILLHFHGGEPFYGENVAYIENFLSESSVERIDILTNGLGSEADYVRILSAYKDRIHRVGFTYHRKMNVDAALFESNVLAVRALGISVYVKELLFVDERDAIHANKKYWEDKGISFKIQDFRGWDRGRSFEENNKYTLDDMKSVDAEYLQNDPFTCSCRPGYKMFRIRGGNLSWQHSGDVIACWCDPKVIGNIQDNEFCPEYEIKRIQGIIVVECSGDTGYRGTFDRDQYFPGMK